MADFAGGSSSRRLHVVLVTLVAQVGGTVPLLIAIALVERSGPDVPALAWGAGAGIAGAVGVGPFYRGLAVGRMSVVAPITGVLASVVPVAFALSLGERPGPWVLAGVVISVAGVALVSASKDPVLDTNKPRTAGLVDALVAGLGFGLFFVILDRAPGDSGLWPSLAVRLSATCLYLAAAIIVRVPLRLPARDLLRLSLIGVADVTALIMFLLATREGLLSVVAVLTSLYPAVTVLLARVVLDERFASMQRFGLASAVAGVVLIAAG